MKTPSPVPATKTSLDAREMFTTPRDAVAELKRRRADTALERAVSHTATPQAALIRSHCTKPTALLFRQLATPTHEVLRFLRRAKSLGLQPVILEYTGDKFVGSGNSYKRSLGKMPLYQYTGSDGRDMVRFKTVIDFNKSTGKSIGELTASCHVPLVDFHHMLFENVTGLAVEDVCIDGTPWFKANGGVAEHYYTSLLSFFIRDAILFDNFMLNSKEKRFTTQIVLPAFQEVTKRFGVRPLIVQLLPGEDELRAFWDEYPKKVEALIPDV